MTTSVHRWRILVMRGPVTLSTPNGSREVTAVTTWIREPAGDDLRGTVERRLEEVNQGHPPQRLSGTRIAR